MPEPSVKSQPRSTQMGRGSLALVVGTLVVGTPAAVMLSKEFTCGRTPEGGPNSLNALTMPEAPPAFLPFGVDDRREPTEVHSNTPSPGWSWIQEPRKLTVEELKCAVRLVLKDEEPAWQVKGEELVISFKEPADSSFRLVLGYGDGRRVVRSPAAQGDGFRLYFLPDDFPEWLGVEAVDEAGLALIRKAAFQEARRLNLTVLPPLRLGETVSFELRTVEGKLISSQDFEGKAAVIFEWATWCNSCHREIEALAKLAALHKGEIVFIGICHDEPAQYSRAEAQMAEISQKLAPHVFHVALFKLSQFSAGASLPRTQELWQLVRDGTGQSYGLPRTVVLKRDSQALLLDTAGFQKRL